MAASFCIDPKTIDGTYAAGQRLFDQGPGSIANLSRTGRSRPLWHRRRGWHYQVP